MTIIRQALRLITFSVVLTQAAAALAANLNVVWTSEVGQFAPLWVTKEAKLFEKYGK